MNSGIKKLSKSEKNKLKGKNIKFFDSRFSTLYGFSVYNLDNIKIMELTECIDDILFNNQDNLNFVSRAYMDKIFLMSMRYNDLSSLGAYISNIANSCLRILKQDERLDKKIIYQFIILHNLIKDTRNGFFSNFSENIDKVVNEFKELYKVYQHQTRRIDEMRIRPIIDDIMEDYKNMNALIDNEYLFSQFIKWQRKLGFFAFSKYAQRIGLLVKEKIQPEQQQVGKKKRGRPPKNKKPETVLNLSMLNELVDGNFSPREKILVDKLMKERKKRISKEKKKANIVVSDGDNDDLEDSIDKIINTKHSTSDYDYEYDEDDDDDGYNLDNFVDLTNFKD